MDSNSHVVNRDSTMCDSNCSVLSSASWGAGSTHFLECQESYQHGTAALQASQVWMLTEAATLLRASGKINGAAAAEAVAMERAASTLLKQMLPQLSRDEGNGGWWHTVAPVNNGTATPQRVEVRMIHDFLVRERPSLFLDICLYQ